MNQLDIKQSDSNQSGQMSWEVLTSRRFVAKRDIFAKVLASKWHLSITVQVGVQRTTISKQSWQDKNSGIFCSLEFFFEREVKLAEEGL